MSPDNSGPGGPDRPDLECPDCDGTGEIDGDSDEDTRTCPRCHGSGLDLPWDTFEDDVI